MKTKHFFPFALSLLVLTLLAFPVGNVKSQEEAKGWHYISSGYYDGITIFFNTEGIDTKLRFTRSPSRDVYANIYGKRIKAAFDYSEHGGGTPDHWLKDTVTLEGEKKNQIDVTLKIRGEIGSGGAQSFCFRILGFQVEGQEYKERSVPDKTCISATGREISN